MITANTFINDPSWDNLSATRRFIYRVLSSKTPKRIKRLLFVSSLLGLLDDAERTDKEMTVKLNSLLKVAHNHEALLFPIAVKSLIWNKLIKEPNLTIEGTEYSIFDFKKIKNVDRNYDLLISFILTQMPIWLVYGSKNLMHHDLQMLLEKVLN